MKKLWIAAMMIAGLLILYACGSGESDPVKKDGSALTAKANNEALAGYMLDTAPENAISLLKALGDDSFDKEIAVRGRIGEIASGRAGFRLYDETLKDCYRSAEDCCDIPWDY